MTDHDVNTTIDTVQRYYGVDFGNRSIIISRIDVSKSNKLNTLNSSKIDILSDQAGYSSIFNGMQYIDTSSIKSNDSSLYYNKRRFGNECMRSQPTISIAKSNSNSSDSYDSIKINDNEYLIPRTISEVAIISLIRELIVTDIKNTNPTEKLIDHTKVIFAISSSYSANKRDELIIRINSVFIANELDGDSISIDYILTDYALAFAKFGTRYPEYIGRSFIDPNLMYKSNIDYERKISLIVDASYSQTNLLVVATCFDMDTGKYCLHLLDRLKINLSGSGLDEIIIKMVIDQGVEKYGESNRGNLSQLIHSDRKEIEKIKHNLSLYPKVSDELDFSDFQFKIHINRHNIELRTESELRYAIYKFYNKYNFSTIEPVGGFSRSFLIQDILNDFIDSVNNVSIIRSLNPDESVAKGTALYYIINDMNSNAYKLNQKPNFEFKRWFSKYENTIDIAHTSLMLNKSDNGESYYTNNNFNNEIRFAGQSHLFTTREKQFTEAYDRYINPDKYNAYGLDPNMKMVRIKIDPESPIFITYDGIEYTAMINNLDQKQTCDIYIQFDMVDIPVIIRIGNGHFVDYCFTINKGPYIENIINEMTRYTKVESELCRLKQLYDRIGTLYNKMEGFYFDKDGYISKKKSIRYEIDRIKNSYSYIHTSITKLEKSYKRLIDTYEFCRIVTVDADILDNPFYAPDSEVSVDPRLTKDMINKLIQKESGLRTMENMMKSVE